MFSPRLCAAQLTPSGRGAVATIGVRGTGAIDAVSRLFLPASGSPLSTIPAGRVVFGRFSSGQAVAEELVVGLVTSDELEIHCHGGSAAAEAVLAALASEGCDVVTWREWTITKQADSIAAEAIIALTESRTERTAAILLSQLRGDLRKDVLQITRDLTAENAAAAEGALRRLLSRSGVGKHLTTPWRVVLAGRPNVGKSSVINALLGYSRSIVFNEPGTTRDVLTAITAFDGWPVELADTAGIRDSPDEIEREGAERARLRAADANLIILVTDASESWSAFDEQLWQTLRHLAPILVAHNKADLQPASDDERPPGIAVSALTGEGIHGRIGANVNALVPSPPRISEGIPFTDRQAQLLARSLNYFKHGERRLAVGSLFELLEGPLP